MIGVAIAVAVGVALGLAILGETEVGVMVGLMRAVDEDAPLSSGDLDRDADAHDPSQVDRPDDAMSISRGVDRERGR